MWSIHRPVRSWRTLWRRRCACRSLWPCVATLLPDRIPDGDVVPWNMPTARLQALRVPPYVRNSSGWWSA